MCTRYARRDWRRMSIKGCPRWRCGPSNTFEAPKLCGPCIEHDETPTALSNRYTSASAHVDGRPQPSASRGCESSARHSCQLPYQLRLRDRGNLSGLIAASPVDKTASARHVAPDSLARTARIRAICASRRVGCRRKVVHALTSSFLSTTSMIAFFSSSNR